MPSRKHLEPQQGDTTAVSGEVDEILLQLQTGTLYADNTEPAMTNNRKIATKAIASLINKRVVECSISAIKIIGYRLDNHTDMGETAKTYWQVINDYEAQLNSVKEQKHE